MHKLLVGLLAMLALTASPAVAQRPQYVWPEMKPYSRSVAINLRSSKTMVKFDLKDVEDRTAYVLGCLAVDEDVLTKEKIDMILNGQLLCILQPVDADIRRFEWNNLDLLSEDESESIYSRGDFDARMLFGACARYADYGLRRTFSLRHFRLTLELRDVEFPFGRPPEDFRFEEDRSDYPVGHAKLVVTLTPDLSADTAKPKPPLLGRPRPVASQPACATPVPNLEKPFCRNGNGSVVSCGPDWYYQKWPFEDPNVRLP